MPGAGLERGDRIKPKRSHRDRHRAWNMTTPCTAWAGLNLDIADEFEQWCVRIHTPCIGSIISKVHSIYRQKNTAGQMPGCALVRAENQSRMMIL
jgi:hypothetical protein